MPQIPPSSSYAPSMEDLLASMEARKRKELQLRALRNREEAYAQQASAPIDAIRVRGGGTTSIGGVPIQQPDIVTPNYAGAIGNVVSGYLEGQARKEADLAEQDYARTAQLDALQQDAFQQAQAREQKALEQKNPAAFFQNIESLGLSPSAVRLAAQYYGMDEATAGNIASEYAAGKQREQQQAAELRRAPADTDLTFAQYQALSPEQQKQFADFRGRGSSRPDGLTATERNLYTKQGTEAKRIVESSARLEGTIAKLKTLPKEQFLPLDRIQGALAASENPLFSFVGAYKMSPEKQRLYRVIIPQALDDLRKIGGSDTEKEYARISKQYPNLFMDYEQFQSAMSSMEDAISRDSSNASEALAESNKMLSQERQPFTPPQAQSDDELVNKYLGGGR